MGYSVVGSDFCQPLDVILVVDASESIRDNNPSNCTLDTECDNWFKVREFARNLFFDITPLADTHFSYVIFSASSSHYDYFFSDRTDISQRFYNNAGIQFGGVNSKNTRLAIEKARTTFAVSARLNVLHLMVIITDDDSYGLSYDPMEKAVSEAQAARREGVFIVVVGMGENARSSSISLFASNGLGADHVVSSI